jgi:hypothetical protein
MANETRVVNLRKEKYDVYMGRAGKGQDGYFGNPHPVGGLCVLCKTTHDRKTSVEAFNRDFWERLRDDPEYKRRILELKGKALGCFCAPQACHCDVIAEYLNTLK